MDFGCGLGTLIPFLVQKSDTVLAVDPAIKHLIPIANKNGWSNIIFNQNINQIKKNFANKVDVILALDVLEHIDDLHNTIEDFRELLKNNGEIYISGPTENILYKLSRKMAGYDGHYHIRNIY